eukprot:SAG22_NODE_2902_length_2115_cov_1.796627_2_plen_208_part_00
MSSLQSKAREIRDLGPLRLYATPPSQTPPAWRFGPPTPPRRADDGARQAAPAPADDRALHPLQAGWLGRRCVGACTWCRSVPVLLRSLLAGCLQLPNTCQAGWPSRGRRSAACWPSASGWRSSEAKHACPLPAPTVAYTYSRAGHVHVHVCWRPDNNYRWTQCNVNARLEINKGEGKVERWAWSRSLHMKDRRILRRQMQQLLRKST